MFERWVCVAAVVFCSSLAQGSELTKVVNEYCVACHNGRISEGKIAFNRLDPDQPWKDADAWERVLRQLRARTMPPVDNPRPEGRVYEGLVSELGTALDRGATTGGARVSDADLAGRLAKFLWRSEPDTGLMEAARKGRLDDPAALDAQVRRMIADPKISGFVSGFFDEWLGLGSIATMPVDAAAFPEFDADLRESLLRETELFVMSQLREDRPATELWTANYTFVNDRLAKYYGIRGAGTGAEFRRVTLEGTERAGLLGQGSFLIATSVLTKHAAVDAPSTSPAGRAKWIRVHFLGVPVPHPIPGIPPLQKGVLLSAQLRTLPDPSCTQCHSNFFPLGYALENFDALGRWRTEAEHEPIDVSGVMPDGTEFDGPAELRRALLQRRDAFLTTITEKIFAYALEGKTGLERATPAERMPAVRAVLRDAERKNYTWSALFSGIAKSSFFQAK